MTRTVRCGWLLVVATGLAAGCGERQEARYATYRDAVAHGAVHRGWMPAYVPHEATEIDEVHDLDTNAQLLRFRSPPDALTAMAAGLLPVPGPSVPLPPRHLSPPGGRMWRHELGSGTLPEGMAAYRAHLASGRVHCVAVDMRGVTAYAWTCSE